MEIFRMRIFYVIILMFISSGHAASFVQTYYKVNFSRKYFENYVLNGLFFLGLWSDIH